ncbi:MAG: FecR domain-containing protein [Luteolibacter sp.]
MRIPIVTLALAVSVGMVPAAPLKLADITEVINDVKVSENSAVAKAASKGQKLNGSSTVLTGRKSRAQLSFADSTVTRIGANSIFRFGENSRDLAIDKGSFLLQVPKNAGGATIRTATVTAAITGTTTMIEASPGHWFKFIVIEGEAKLIHKNGGEIDVFPGEMIVMDPNARAFPRKININLKKLVGTSALMDKRIFGPLNKPAVAMIDRSVNNQMKQRRVGILVPSGVIVRGPNAPRGNPKSSAGGQKTIAGSAGGGALSRPPASSGGGPIVTTPP